MRGWSSRDNQTPPFCTSHSPPCPSLSPRDYVALTALSCPPWSFPQGSSSPNHGLVDWELWLIQELCAGSLYDAIHEG